MTRIASLNQRYAASAHLVKNGVELVVVGDRRGGRLNSAIRRLLVTIRDDGPELWEDLAGAAKSLRWRLLTQPQPVARNSALIDAVDQVRRHTRRLRGAVGDESLLDELLSAAAPLSEADSPLGPILLRSIEEIGTSECVVVAASKAAQVGLAEWLGERGVLVMTPGELEREQPTVDQSYVVGPPRFFRSSFITAPVTSDVSFLLPSWFADRTIPRSALAPFAEGAIRVTPRFFTEGDTREPELEESVAEVEDDFLPQPSWGRAQSDNREPDTDEVAAHKVLLSGNLAIWLDDGDRIRALDPEQPPGERVIYIEVRAVRPGTYLLLREGETEHGALQRSALGKLSGKAAAVEASQRAWKVALSRKISEFTYGRTVRELRIRGVKTADRARAWTDPNLIRPNRDGDFEALLEWLGIPIQPTFGYATMLRRAHHQASADLREQLEKAVGDADLSVLEREGHWSLASGQEGVRGLVATRVLAVSPYTQIVARHDARVPFSDRSGQWLE